MAAVVNRPAHQSVLDALQGYFGQRGLSRSSRRWILRETGSSTPALRAYARRMWTRHEASLARAIADSTPDRPDAIGAAALARFSLAARNLAGEQPDPHRARTDTFAHLPTGWGPLTAAAHPRAHTRRNAAMRHP